MSEQVFISVPDAGRRQYGVGKAMSYAYVEQGLIPTVRVGRRLLVPVQALEALAAELAERAEAMARERLRGGAG